MVLFVQKTKAMHLKEPSPPGKTLMLDTRFMTRTIDLQSFVLSKTYRKKVKDNLTLCVQTVKIRVPYACGLARIKSKNQIAITGNKQQ